MVVVRGDDNILVGELRSGLYGDDVARVEGVGAADSRCVIMDIGLQTDFVKAVEEVILDNQRLWLRRVADVLLHPSDSVVQVHRIDLMDHLDDGRVGFRDHRVGLVAVAFVVNHLGIKGVCNQQNDGKE